MYRHDSKSIILYLVLFILGLFCSSLANGTMSLPSRERKWTNMKGLMFNLTTNTKLFRDYIVFRTATNKVLKQTNGLYPAPMKIIDVRMCNR